MKEAGETDIDFDDFDLNGFPLRDFELVLISGLDMEFDCAAQLTAIHTLIAHQRHFDTELRNEIKRVEGIAATLTGTANSHAVDHLVDLIHESGFQDIAHSMAAVGMLAPFIESIFRAAFRGVGQELPNKDLVKHIMKVVDDEELGIKRYMPTTLGPTLEALFAYRNKLFHFGFEWPKEERLKFHRRLSEWPCDWFGVSTSGGNPWMFYMSTEFIKYCLDIAVQVLTGFARYRLSIS